MNKKTLVLLLVIIFLISCNKKTTVLEINLKPQIVNNNKIIESELSEQTKPLIKITENDILEIFVRADGAPGMYLDDDGILKGFYVELEKAIMKEMGQKYKLSYYFDAGPVVLKLRDGEAHLALAVPDLPDYRAFLNLSINYEQLDYITIVHKKSHLTVPDNKEEFFAKLSGKKVGVQTRGHIYQLLRPYKDIKIIEYPTTTIALEALNRGELDAVPEVKRIMDYYSKIYNWDLKAIGETIFTLNISTGFSKELDPTVLNRYNKALKTLIDSGFVDELHKTYFGQ